MNFAFPNLGVLVMKFKFRGFIFLAVLAGSICVFDSPAYADSQPPPWMRQAAAATIPTYEKDVPAVVLHDEQQVTLGTDGKLVTVENFAVKLLNREGRRYAIARAFYLVSAGKIRNIEAWLIRSDGTTKSYEKGSIVDIIADPEDVYNEGRIKLIDATGEVDTGHVFGYTVVSEDLPLFYQDTWQFQDRLPTLLSRYSLNLPQGWKASSITFNSSDIKPSATGSNYSWEMRNLQPIPPEPLSPAVENIAPRIAVNYSPDNAAQSVNRAFSGWLDVSRWAATLYDPQVVIDDSIAIKARDLTANAKTELEKIHAIGSFVQNMQYISIDIGVAHGNGYKPRPSNLVLSRGYGDCKDKANLMRALLKTLKIDAYPIAIYSGDPTFVREEWASPRQFNHCIIAVKVSDGTNSPTVITHPKLGRLLIFDATDQFTPVGDLPDYLQGSNALIIAGENGGLAKMPITSPETDLLDRNIEVSLSELGAINGTIREKTSGQTSAYFRREHRGLSASDYKKAIEGWLTRGATGAQLVNLTAKDKQANAGFDLDVEFSAARYGQLMQNRLLVFKPVIVGRRNAIILTEPKRTNPIEIDSNAMRETVTYVLPVGFAVDEMPNPVTLETNFGKYSTKYESKDGKLVLTRSITMNRITIAADKYAGVKDFFTKILDAEQSPVVLIRK
jgi:transglutaminase-like putative cysteine protease